MQNCIAPLTWQDGAYGMGSYGKNLSRITNFASFVTSIGRQRVM